MAQKNLASLTDISVEVEQDLNAESAIEQMIADLEPYTFLRSKDLPGTSAQKRKVLDKALKEARLIRFAIGMYYRGVLTEFGMVPLPHTYMPLLYSGDYARHAARCGAATKWGVRNLLMLADVERGIELPQHPGILALNTLEVSLLILLEDAATYIQAPAPVFVEKVVDAIAKTGFAGI